MPEPSTKRLILVIDDDADIREALSDTLEDEGYPVAAAASGPEALAYLRSHPLPALVFLDWNMAPMNAPQLMAELAKEPAFATLPVVVVTAEARASQQAAAGRYQGFILKPVDLDRLFAFALQFAGK